MDLVQVSTSCEIGRHIVEHEQQGKGRAAYGQEVLNRLSEKLIVEFGKGFSRSNLEYMRRFYLVYALRRDIFQTVSGKFLGGEISHTPSGKSRQPSPSKPFALSWSHYVFLTGIKNPAVNGDHFFVDLVFYYRILRCYVLIDLKIGKLMHQDLGQMQMNVNAFDRKVKTEKENPTIGILLCKQKSEALVS